MDYEQKYKEALKVMEGLYNVVRYHSSTDALLTSQTIEKAFPELKESEDERMRKEIVDYLRKFIPHVDYDLVTKSKVWISWLEKQGEQNPNDNVELKFKVGDWITNGKYTWKITDIKPLDYILQSQNGDMADDNISYVDENFRLWTIQDAKDGDVLKEDSCTFIIERMKPDGTAIVRCCLFDDGDFDLMGSTLSFDVDSTYPATKEQRDLLFQKMKESGYEWDADKKELKKIEQKPTNIEPKFKVGDIIKYVGEREEFSKEEHTIKKILDDCYLTIDDVYIPFKFEEYYILVNKNPSWSEEDEEMLNDIINELYPYGECSDYPTDEEREYYYERGKMIDWLKSLKPNHWKPTKEQLEALQYATGNGGTYNKEALNRLYNDLKNFDWEE